MINLTQADADRLLAMVKHAPNTGLRPFPAQGGYLDVPLVTKNSHEKFILTINRTSKIEAKLTYQTRARQVVILARLDFGIEHRNPDGTRVGSPHLHIYKEGYGDKWAYELPHTNFQTFDGASNMQDWLDKFLDFCQINPKNVVNGRQII